VELDVTGIVEKMRAGPIAVPPLCLNGRHGHFLNAEENAKLLDHLRRSGIRTILYGGNANLANAPERLYRNLLSFLADKSDRDMTVIPSAGPDYGRLMDQAEHLRAGRFQAVMVLPFDGPLTCEGMEIAIRRFADLAATPVITYLKSEKYLSVRQIAALVADGVVVSVKYAIPRPDVAQDAFLDELLASIDPAIVFSGFGDPPALPHLRFKKLAGFTSGIASLVPRLSIAYAAAMRGEAWDEAARLLACMTPLEDARDRWGGIATLHEAVAIGGIAETGPILPCLGPLPDGARTQIRPIVTAALLAEAAIS
jgi:dihydrodipicolinate synthase/N-acetylneuraminate lyase